MSNNQETLELMAELDTHEYEERADYLPPEYIKTKTAKGKFFEDIQKKLFQVGAKLLIGPRGTGKTHHMRLAYITCKEDSNKPLPVYVSFNHYLRLETYLNESSNAIGVFHAWTLGKIILSCIEDYGDNVLYEGIDAISLKEFIQAVEKQQYNSDFYSIVQKLSVEKAKDYIESSIQRQERKRAILLLDDAALTLTPEYMVEFFEVFRSIKSSLISPKASVYPGTTQYGPRFHLGHDAEPVNVWLSVENPNYIEFMTSLTSNRFEGEPNVPNEILELFKYAAFGIPRAYIMMVREYQQQGSSTAQKKFNKVIYDRKQYTTAEYLSIADKLKQYRGVIELGNEFLTNIVNYLKSLNHQNIDKKGDNFEKIITVGITGIPQKAERMIRFLTEAGLLYEEDSTSHGADRRLRRFIPHMAFVLDERVLTKSRGFSATKLLEILTGRSAKHPARPSFESLIKEDQLVKLNLDLPPCANCGARRLTEKQKFCHECGKPLVDYSTFRECMAKPLSELPLTDFQKKAIEQYTSFKTVEDVIRSQDPSTELQKAHRIKTARAEDIYNRIDGWVNTWVNEFLV
ncbi:zinc ribbon domain-containing protein [Vreelandella salicampi]|uniref:Zinc ribbon domain-containing protein n=1 Tax=Vreelandella salicampi TaxID=1449798 RepID=A0A7Z0LIS4_9GAMM|nr:zinc ribbon domain-containing protein [Halomonas salicampi]NYS59673.1 zinc ribbon domain-containing protein [Halomonas salicampi]